MSTPTLNVLVADDHSVVRRGVRAILSEAFPGIVIGEADSGLEAVAKGLAEPWDVVLLDITMPHGNGVQVLRTLHRAKPDLRIIMLSMLNDSHFVARCLAEGASGYITKEKAPEELVTAIKAVLAGGTFVITDAIRDLGLAVSQFVRPSNPPTVD
jgi:DNA-binding NarL/FixJ family response regulator